MSYKILVLNWQDIRNPLGGGAEVHFHEIFKRIAQQGHQVTLLCCGYDDLPDEEIIDGIHVIRRGNRYCFNYLVPMLYRKYSRQMKFDIVVDDINKIPFYSPLYVKEPVIGIMHHLFGSSIFIQSAIPIALYVTLAEKLVPLIYRHVPMAVVSNSTRQELMTKGFPEVNLRLVHNAVEHEAYQYDPARRSPTPVVGYLGRIKKYKSVNHLILAFSEVQQQIPNAKLLIVGDGDYLYELKKLVGKLQLEPFVTFTGLTKHQQKIDYLNQMWLSVNPSPKEGWGLTVIEANNCGVPVIAADSPGLRDSVISGKTGFLYPYGDYHRLAKLIIELIQKDHLRKSFTEQCINWAHQFNWEHSAMNMLELIEQALTRR